MDSYGKFKVEEQRKYKNNVWTSYTIINAIKNYIKDKKLNFVKALDPCAGSGRLIEEFSDYDWTGYEISETIFNECLDEKTKTKITNADFFEIDDETVYDVCICNPPYNKNGGINRWVKKILDMSQYLFLIVPYNFINKIKNISNLIDYITIKDDEMDRVLHNKVMIFIFDKNTNDKNILETNPLFYIEQPKEDIEPIYLKNYVEPIEVKTNKQRKVDDIPEGIKYPVYTIAGNPIKFTDLETECPGDVLLFCNQFITSSTKILKHSDVPPYLNASSYLVMKFKDDEKKKEILNNIRAISLYLQELFKKNNLTTLIYKKDLLDIPIYINGTDKQYMIDEFKKYIKKFKFYEYITDYNINFK